MLDCKIPILPATCCWRNVKRRIYFCPVVKFIRVMHRQESNCWICIPTLNNNKTLYNICTVQFHACGSDSWWENWVVSYTREYFKWKVLAAFAIFLCKWQMRRPKPVAANKQRSDINKLIDLLHSKYLILEHTLSVGHLLIEWAEVKEDISQIKYAIIILVNQTFNDKQWNPYVAEIILLSRSKSANNDEDSISS